jgi:hypothetical protein
VRSSSVTQTYWIMAAVAVLGILAVVVLERWQRPGARPHAPLHSGAPADSCRS